MTRTHYHVLESTENSSDVSLVKILSRGEECECSVGKVKKVLLLNFLIPTLASDTCPM